MLSIRIRTIGPFDPDPKRLPKKEIYIYKSWMFSLEGWSSGRYKNKFISYCLLFVLISVADPGSGAFLTPRSGTGKKPGSGSGMNNPDHIFVSFETIFFGLKYVISLMRIRDPVWKKFGSGIRDGKRFGSGIDIPDPQHWFSC
jgi:hypothetical protein